MGTKKQDRELGQFINLANVGGNARGHRLYSDAQKWAVVKGWNASGESGYTFSRRIGIAAALLGNWKRSGGKSVRSGPKNGGAKNASAALTAIVGELHVMGNGARKFNKQHRVQILAAYERAKRSDPKLLSSTFALSLGLHENMLSRWRSMTSGSAQQEQRPELTELPTQPASAHANGAVPGGKRRPTALASLTINFEADSVANAIKAMELFSVDGRVAVSITPEGL